MTQIDVEYIVRMRDALTKFHDNLAEVYRKYNSAPVVGSQAITEQRSFGKPESVLSNYVLASQLIEYSGEHLTLFVKSVTEPVEVLACWTTVRSMLEACAISAWLLDPTIDVVTRVGRCYSHRHDGQKQQLTFAHVAGVDPAMVQQILDNIEDMAKEAKALGIPVKHDKKGIQWIGQAMIGPTAIIGQVLGDEKLYRLLSAVAHGHNWAHLQLGYKPVPVADHLIDGVSVKAFSKSLNHDGVALLGSAVMRSIARATWNQCQYFGWDAARLKEILETLANELHSSAKVRFWL